MVPNCPSPLTASISAGGPASAVISKSTAPTSGTLAETVTPPEVVPSMTVVVAIPSAFVVEDAGATLASPVVTCQVTDTSGTGR